MALPIDAHADKIAEHVARHRVTVIHGETGSRKKSLRVPLILLEADPDAKMFVSQPGELQPAHYVIGSETRIATPTTLL